MKLVILCFVLYSFAAQSQNHDNIWLIGQETTSSTKLDFNNGVLGISNTVRNMPVSDACVSMSDSLGNLIFYTNGIKINNAQYQLMQNGDGLNPGQIANDFAQSGYPVFNSMIAIPHPNQTNKYYLFHQSLTYASDAAGFGEHLYYTLIDMNANNGLGRVEQKNQMLNSDSIGRGQLQAIKHGNGRDWWLVQYLAWSNGFHVFLITGDTIVYSHQQYIGNNQNFSWGGAGQSVFSLDGSKYARYDDRNDLDIFNFDRCTGSFFNPIHIPIQDSADTFPAGYPVGVAISQNSQYLYVSSYNLIYQFDLLATNIPSSKDTVAIHDGFWGDFYPTAFSFAMLGADNKIYVLPLNTHYLHVIDNPDIGGINCNVQQHSINVPYRNGLFLTNFPHYRTGALTGSACDTLTSVAEITTQEANIKIYPNPASTSITLESEQPMQRVVVYNALGQQVMNISEKPQQLLELETNQLENGVYFVRIGVDNRFITKQFQIMR